MPMTLARVGLSLVLLFVALTVARPRSPRQIHLLLGLSIATPAAFYVFAMELLRSGGSATVPVGYDFMPYVILGVLGLFPITLGMGVTLMAIVGAALVFVAARDHTGGDLETLNRLWAFAMFAGAALWVQAGQLLMLLQLYRRRPRTR